MKILTIDKFIKQVKSNRKLFKYGCLLGLDVGTKHIGVAQYDIISTSIDPISTLERNRSYGYKIGVEKLSNTLQPIINDNRALGIVIGFPLMMDGSLTSLSKSILQLAQDIQCHYPSDPDDLVSLPAPLPGDNEEMICTFWDERESTMNARSAIKGFSRKLSAYHKHKDHLAACIILQSFVDHNLL